MYDHKLQQHLALKMVRNEKRFHRQAQEEIRILEHLRKQDRNGTMNVVHMLENFTFRNHICMTFELLSMNLYELIKRNKFQGFSLPLVRKFAHSILQCLEALSRHRIIHCDLKPENILLKQQGRSGIKVSTRLAHTVCASEMKQPFKWIFSFIRSLILAQVVSSTSGSTLTSSPVFIGLQRLSLALAMAYLLTCGALDVSWPSC